MMTRGTTELMLVAGFGLIGERGPWSKEFIQDSFDWRERERKAVVVDAAPADDLGLNASLKDERGLQWLSRVLVRDQR